MKARFVPVEVWPGNVTRPRKKSPFAGSWANTLATLDRELRHLRAREVVIQGYFRPQDIRLDGWPKSGSAPTGPGVIVTFETKMGPLSYPCDTYLRWEDNLRAIALALAMLRAVERYGVTRHQEQYKGWLKLPPPADRPFLTKQDAARFIAQQAFARPDVSDLLVREILGNGDQMRSYYRTAAGRLHPDMPGGSHDLFIRLGAAKKLLEGAC